MLPEFVDKKLVDFVDIFCEENYFSSDDTKLLCKRANELDIRVKIHTNQFNSIGGIRAGVDNGALSVDHLEVMTRDDLNALKNSKTMPVLLPGCSFFLGIDYANARDLLSNGISFAIASDYNPGSSPTGNMNFILSLACNKLKLSAEQAINAVTINGAYAMGVSQVLSFLYAKSKFIFLNSGLKFPVELKNLLFKYQISILNISISAFKIFSTTIKKRVL